MNTSDLITDMRRKIKAQREELRDAVRKAFHEEAEGLFVTHPKLQAFRWTQYTPYFNDGDECTFSAHTSDPGIKFEGVVPEYDEEYQAFYDYPGAKHPSDEFQKAGQDIRSFLGAFETDDLRSLFGDHKEITVTATGVTVDNYSHD